MLINKLKPHHAHLVYAFVALCNIVDLQPKIVGQLETDRIPLVGHKRVHANGEQLKLLTLLRFVVRI